VYNITKTNLVFYLDAEKAQDLATQMPVLQKGVIFVIVDKMNNSKVSSFMGRF